MKPSLCPCGAPAEYSVCVLVSTLRVRPRRQKCGRAQLFCAACIQRPLTEEGGAGAHELQQSLGSAYTAVFEHSTPESESMRMKKC